MTKTPTRKEIEEKVDSLSYTIWRPVGGLSDAKWYSRETVIKALTTIAEEAEERGYKRGLADGSDKPLLAIENVVEKAREDETKSIIHSWNKAEQRLDGTTKGAINCIEQFRETLTTLTQKNNE